jgi:hypothetical protein
LFYIRSQLFFMPSNAYINFLHIRIDVLKLIETHSFYVQKKRGRKDLGHLTRSAVVMLCAAWERYNEDLLLESISYLSKVTTDINNLNKQIKKTISAKVKNDKNEIKAIELAGDGWKSVWLSYAMEETELLNTPKSNKLKLLFNTYLGLPDYTALWKTCNPCKIDEFVSERGAIAHNGNQTPYITLTKLKRYHDLIIKNVIAIDSNMALELNKLSGLSLLPWTQNYFNEIEKY